MDRKSNSILVLSELESVLNQDNSLVSHAKLTDRRSLGNKANHKNININSTNPPNKADQIIKNILQRVAQIEKRVEVLGTRITQLVKDSDVLSQGQKLFELQKKYDKIEYFVWESKQIEKQNRDIAESLKAEIIQNKEVVDKNIDILKTNNQLLLSTMQTVIGQLIQKVELNKTDTTKQLKKICEAMQDMCVVQSKMQEIPSNIKTIPIIRGETNILDQSSIRECIKERKSLPLRNLETANHRKVISSHKNSYTKKKNSIV